MADAGGRAAFFCGYGLAKYAPLGQRIRGAATCSIVFRRELVTIKAAVEKVAKCLHGGYLFIAQQLVYAAEDPDDLAERRAIHENNAPGALRHWRNKLALMAEEEHIITGYYVYELSHIGEIALFSNH